VRPTGDRVREALFNIWGQRLEGLRFLDVCAGSGAVSLEALSRGAAVAVALEWDAALCSHIQEEAERTGLAEGLRLRRGDARAELGRLRREGVPPFDLAFADPPWGERALREEILRILFESPPLCQMVAVECPQGEKEPGTPSGARLIRRARYGDTALIFYEIGEGGALRASTLGDEGEGRREGS